MVAIVKPRRPGELTTDAEILRQARRLIELNKERFICNAICEAGQARGLPVQIVDLVHKVRQAIHPHAYYTLWAMANPDAGVNSQPGWQKRGRLALIDKLIAEVQHG